MSYPVRSFLTAVNPILHKVIVFVCDKTTDLPLLHQILAAAWAAERRDGNARGSGEISVVRVERQTRSEFALLMHRLLRRPQPAAVPL
jgi:hypothetical protein